MDTVIMKMYNEERRGRGPRIDEDGLRIHGKEAKKTWDATGRRA